MSHLSRFPLGISVACITKLRTGLSRTCGRGADLAEWCQSANRGIGDLPCVSYDGAMEVAVLKGLSWRLLHWGFILVLLFCPGALAQEPAELSGLSLEEAVALALRNNPGLQAERKNLAVGEAEIVEAGRLPNPNILSDSGIAEDTYRLGIQQLVELGGKRRKRQALARAKMAVTVDRVRQDELELRAAVRRAYSGYYLGREKYGAIRERAENYRALVAAARDEAGSRDPTDIIEATLIALSIENELQAAALSMEQARNALSFLLAQPLAKDVRLAPPPRLQGPLPDPETLIREALRIRPDSRELAHAEEVDHRETALIRSLRVPDLTLAAGPDLVTGETDRLEAFIMAQVELPVFDRQQGPLLALKARREQLADRQREMTGRVTLEVRNAWQACRVHESRVRNYEERLLEKADAIRHQAQTRFDRGEVSLLTLLSANEAALDVYLAYLDALMDYQNSLADLEQATGLPW